jgi:hypothetical protein
MPDRWVLSRRISSCGGDRSDSRFELERCVGDVDGSWFAAKLLGWGVVDESYITGECPFRALAVSETGSLTARKQSKTKRIIQRCFWLSLEVEIVITSVGNLHTHCRELPARVIFAPLGVHLVSYLYHLPLLSQIT